tara:strand:- start:97 stop:210 length:114 start_codon:yes stop_codon:yes gene_type:complete
MWRRLDERAGDHQAAPQGKRDTRYMMHSQDDDVGDMI